MAEKEVPSSKHPVVLTGVMRGNKVIELDEESFLPDGYRVTLHLILTPEEAIQLSSGAWAGMTPEEIADFEETLSEFYGRPFKMPGTESS